MDAQTKQLRDALDNSQSLLVMILELGEDYTFSSQRDISSIDKDAWAKEGLTKLLTDQIGENRSVLSPAPSAAQTPS